MCTLYRPLFSFIADFVWLNYTNGKNHGVWMVWSKQIYKQISAVHAFKYHSINRRLFWHSLHLVGCLSACLPAWLFRSFVDLFSFWRILTVYVSSFQHSSWIQSAKKDYNYEPMKYCICDHGSHWFSYMMSNLNAKQNTYTAKKYRH